MTAHGSAGRPGSVAAVALLAVLYGAAACIAGVLGLLRVGDLFGALYLVFSILMIAVGIIVLLLARGLWRGRNGARIAVLVLAAISLVVGILNLFDPASFLTAIVLVAVSVAVIALLLSRSARAYFG